MNTSDRRATPSFSVYISHMSELLLLHRSTPLSHFNCSSCPIYGWTRSRGRSHGIRNSMSRFAHKRTFFYYPIKKFISRIFVDFIPLYKRV